MILLLSQPRLSDSVRLFACDELHLCRSIHRTQTAGLSAPFFVKCGPRRDALAGLGFLRHLSDRPNLRRGHLTLRFTADVFPRFSSISYSICCPSLSVLSPARSTAEMWTNTSLPPPPCG